MCTIPVILSRSRRSLLVPVLLAGVCAVPIAGCNKTSMSDVTGSISGADSPMPRGDAELRQYSEQAGRRYEANRNDKAAAMAYARSLREFQQHAQATAILQGLAIRNPNDQQVLALYGKSLADSGRFSEAASVLEKAHTPERPNWSVLSAQGSVADQIGDHERAQGYYAAALRIRPGEPTVLSNLGLSYALSRDLPRAESTLRDAAAKPGADMRVRQNLALVLGLQGKFGEAEELSRRDLSPMDAAANVAAIRRMIAESNTWKTIRKIAPAKERANNG